MSETTGAILQIGGPLPRRLLVDLCTLIDHCRVGLDWGEHGFDPGGSSKTPKSCATDLLKSLHDGQHLALYDDMARDDMMYNLEEWLRAHHIPFTRFSEATGDCEPMRTDYRPGRANFYAPTNAGRETLVSATALQKVMAQLGTRAKPPSRRIATALQTLRKLTGGEVPALPPFTIVPAGARQSNQ